MTRTGGFTIIALVVALAQAPAASSAGTATADLANLVNAARAHHGLGALHRSSVLDRSALLKTQEILRCRSFSHTPCGTSFVRTFQQAGYARARARFGENLYWGSGGLGTAAGAVAAWLRSPPHRANLLGRGWRDVGIGFVHVPSMFGAHDVSIFVLQFGRR